MQVTLTATNGSITLAGTAGLTFSTGDGSADATMTFTGTVPAINTALDGLAFAPTANFTGAASLQIVTSDQGNSGTGGAQSDTEIVSISVTRSLLWVSSASNASVPPGQGGISWTDGEAVAFGNPNLAFEPGTTSDTFTSIFNLDSFAADGNADIDALHLVQRAVTVGSGGSTFTLQAGDVLLSTGANETLGGVTVTTGDVVVFRPTVPGDKATQHHTSTRHLL